MIVYVNKIIEAPFETLADLINIFEENSYAGVYLGIRDGKKLATIEAKRKVRGINGWIASYGIEGGKYVKVESKATAPSQFKTFDSGINYHVETHN